MMGFMGTMGNMWEDLRIKR